MNTQHALISDILFGLRHRLAEWEKAEADQRSEVLIFLTPKIVNRASSIGG